MTRPFMAFITIVLAIWCLYVGYLDFERQHYGMAALMAVCFGVNIFWSLRRALT